MHPNEARTHIEEAHRAYGDYHLIAERIQESVLGETSGAVRRNHVFEVELSEMLDSKVFPFAEKPVCSFVILSRSREGAAVSHQAKRSEAEQTSLRGPLQKD